MRRILPFGSVSAAFLLLAACGDSGESTGAGGGASTSSAGGGTTSTSSTGGGGEAPILAEAGDPCTANEACAGGLCLPEDYFGWAGGYCSQFCDPTLAPCGAGEECVPFGDSSGCFKSCAADGDCTGAAQTCVDVSGDGSVQVCVGGCDTDEQCQVACNADTGGCAASDEVCDNSIDDDDDFGGSGFTDCEDADCVLESACVTMISDACSNATDVSAGGTFTGNTSTGTNAFATVCESFFGSYIDGSGENEVVFVYTATEVGNLSLDVTTTTGSVVWYLRTACPNSGTGLGFCGAETSGAVGIPVIPGDTFYIYIDAYMGDAAYVFDVAFAPLAPVCAAASAITAGSTNGNTNTGSDAISSNCGGGGKEVVYTYTPTATGMLGLVLSSATDQGLHVRSACLDSQSEIDCVDSAFGGMDETLSVPVTSGTPVTVVVDAYGAGEEGPFSVTLTQN